MPQPDGHLSVFPHIMLDRAKPGLIAVNSAGVRFVNEANSYHDFVEGMLRSHQTTPSIPSFLICDRSFIRDFGLGLIHPGTRDLTRFIKSGYLFQGESVAKLAQASASMAARWPAPSSGIIDLPRPASMRISAAAPANSTASTAIPQQAEPVPAQNRSRPLFCGGGLAFRPREQRGIAHRHQRPRADIRTAADPGPLCRGSRRRLDFPRHLSRARHHDRPGHGVCVARGDGYRRASGHDADAAYLIGGRGSTASPASIR